MLQENNMENSIENNAKSNTQNNVGNNHLTMRRAQAGDLTLIQELIRGLAVYEKRPQDVTGTKEQLRYWLFEKNIATVWLAEYGKETVGYALYYPVFGSFAAAGSVYLEDFYLKEEFRGRGFGRFFFSKIAEAVLAEGYTGMEWSCLDWNQTAIGFYRRGEAKQEAGRVYFGLDHAGLEKTAAQNLREGSGIM